MIAKISKKIAIYFADKQIFKYEDIPTYSYGFELLLSTIINGLCLLILAVIMNIVMETALFVLAFIPLRVTAGGYHAKHHWSCCLAINIIFLFFVLLISCIGDSLLLPYIVISAIFSLIIIWRFSPVEAVNKPVSENKIKLLRKRSIVIAFINIAVAVTCYFIPAMFIKYKAYYLSGAFAASLSMILAVITIKHNKNHL
jgi:Membrane protein putatively involved in post-translational modification of the autoinducing quorum-sensing peptide